MNPILPASYSLVNNPISHKQLNAKWLFILTFALLILLGFSSFAQTTLLDPFAAGGFETGTTFASNGWSVAADGNNNWYVGTVAKTAGLRGAYIDKNNTAGGGNAYNGNIATFTHIYRDVTFPAGATSITLTFKWKCVGEVGYDWLSVYLTSTAVTPVGGSAVPATAILAPLNNNNAYTTATYNIPNTAAGTTQRLIFTWQNDGSVANQPPASIDEVKIVYTPPAPCNATPSISGPSATPSTFNCSGTPTLNLASYANNVLGVTYQWQSSPANLNTWTNIGGALTSPQFTAPLINASTDYRCIATCTNTNQTSTSTTVTATVNVTTASPATASICLGSSQVLTVTSPPLNSVLFSDNFDNVPVMTVTNGGPAATAFIRQTYPFTYAPYGVTFQPPTATACMIAISDISLLGSTTRLASPVINTTGFSTLTLTFSQCLYYLGNTVSIQVSTNGGVSWSNFQTFNNDIPVTAFNGNFTTTTVDLSAYINQPNFAFRFNYNVGWDFWWAIDDVVLSGTPPPVSYSWASNPAANSGLLPGAGIPSAANITTTVTPTATGTYTYTVTSNTPGCTTASSVITVNPSPTAAMSISPNPLCSGQSATVTFTGTPNAVVTYNVNAGPNQIVTLSALGTASFSTGPLAANTDYTLVSVALNGCTTTYNTLTTITVNQTPVFTAGMPSSNSPICSGTDLDLFVSTNPASTTYSWTGPGFGVPNTSQNPVLPNAQTLAAGIYTVTATTSANCSVTGTTTVIVNQTPSIILAGTIDPSTCSGSDGGITISGMLPNTNYTLNYTGIVPVAVAITSDGAGQYTISNLPAATYSNIYVVLNNCNSNILSTILSDPAPPVISSTAFTDPTVCAGADGTITLSGLTANTAYTLSYNNIPQPVTSDGFGNYTISNLAAGVYNNIYVVRFNCTSNIISSLVLSDPAPPAISGIASAGPTTCGGSNGTITLQGLLPLTVYDLYYNNAVSPLNITTDAAGNYTITNLSQGTYTNIYVIRTNCTSNIIGAVTISDPNPPVITAVTNAPICEGQTLTLSSIVTLNGNPVAANSYSWTGPAFVNPVNQANIFMPNAPASATGVYTVTATLAGCTSAPFTVAVDVYAAPPVPTLSVNTPLCSGNDLHLDVTNPDPNFIYIWNGPGLPGPDSTANAVVSNAQTPATGTYSVSVISIQGCGLLVPSNANVTVNQTPGTPVPVDMVYCQEDAAVALSATPSGNPADTIKWYTVPTGGQGSTTAPIPSTAAAGTFIWYVSQTSQPGCEGARVPQNVWVKQKPAAPTTTSPAFTYCQLDSTAVPLTATGDSLQWYTVAVGGTPSSAAPTPSTATPGLFTWYVTQTIDGCESNRLPINVTVIPKPLPPITKNITYCQFDSSVVLGATGQDLKWYDSPLGGTPLAAAPVPSTLLPGITNWYVSQTVNGCESDLALLRVTVYYKPTAAIISSRDEVCQGDTLLISYVGNGTNTTTYDWSWPAGVNIFNGSGQGPYTVQFNNVGTINITLIASENGCSSPLASHTIRVKQSPNVKIGLRSNIVCTDDPAYIEITYLDMEVNNYLWTFNGAHTSSGATEGYDKGPYYLSWSQPGTYVVSLDVIAKDQCWSQAKDTVVIHERPEAKISASVTDDICTGDDVTLAASVNNSKYTYKWLPAAMFDYDYNSPVVKVHADKTSNVSLEVTNEYGCSSMDSVMLHTKTCCEILLPTAFSPNGDGKNDLFRIINPGRHKLESLKVYNRFGQEVFTTSNEKEGWNGSYNGVAQDMGVYQYMVKYICEGKETYLKGDVTLVR